MAPWNGPKNKKLDIFPEPPHGWICTKFCIAVGVANIIIVSLLRLLGTGSRSESGVGAVEERTDEALRGAERAGGTT